MARVRAENTMRTDDTMTQAYDRNPLWLRTSVCLPACFCCSLLPERKISPDSLTP